MSALALVLGLFPPAACANAIQQENARGGDPSWEIPADAGAVITGFASEASVVPGQSVHLHISAPAGARYRVLVYRLGWYHGVGGRLIVCSPGCRLSTVAVTQPPPKRPDPRTGLIVTVWPVTDRLVIPPDAVSGYYEAKLEVLSGQDAGAIGFVPLIVRERKPHAAILVQVPVNTWQAYNPWGGKSLYDRPGHPRAYEVSFDRPYDAREFHDMSTSLELPWIRFLEREGADVAYQTDADTDRDPASLLRHRLAFSIGHDEYWTQRMRDAFDRARSESTNLMFGSNSDLWRIRYASGSRRRTVVEWRNPYADPVHDRRYATDLFRAFGEPECRLMAVEYQEYAQRPLDQPPTPYTVVGPADDPWLSAAGLKPGDVIPGVVGYEWDSLIPGCFHGHLVHLMHAAYPGPDGVARSADMVRATAPSGARVFALGTMELPWAFENAQVREDPRVEPFVKAALGDLTRPAPPARLTIRRTARAVIVSAHLRARDPRVLRVSIRAIGTKRGCADALRAICRISAPRNVTRFAAVAVDAWGRSQPLLVRVSPV